jgi:predicted ferric reductase
MSRRTHYPRTFLSPKSRVALGILLIAVAVGILVGAASIAFHGPEERPALHEGEKKSLHEEGKTWQEIAGKMFGLLAAALVLLQFPLSAKLKFLDRVFGLHRVLFAHRIIGLFTAVFATLHPMFLYASEGKTLGAIRLGVWPELVGAVLLIGVWIGVCLSLWRAFLGIPYQIWYRFHRLGMFSAVVLVAVHALNVPGVLKQGWPLYALLIALILYVALFVWTKAIKPKLLKRSRYSISKVSPAGRDTYAVELSPGEENVFDYAPGQFAFVTFHSESLPLERHPWTISSTPTRPQGLIFTIKCSGDFTAYIGRLKSGDTAEIDGPYGLFSYLASVQDPNQELVMIAGGVGVTPMLSMLRYMIDVDQMRKATLIWSNRTEADILCRDEIEEMEAKLPNLAVHHVLSAQADFQGRTGRLNQNMLKELLSMTSHEACIFVCGPPPMMDSVCRDLKKIGYSARTIFTERFSY